MYIIRTFIGYKSFYPCENARSKGDLITHELFLISVKEEPRGVSVCAGGSHPSTESAGSKGARSGVRCEMDILGLSLHVYLLQSSCDYYGVCINRKLTSSAHFHSARDLKSPIGSQSSVKSYTSVQSWQVS